jgi:hypothetical protein
LLSIQHEISELKRQIAELKEANNPTVLFRGSEEMMNDSEKTLEETEMEVVGDTNIDGNHKKQHEEAGSGMKVRCGSKQSLNGGAGKVKNDQAVRNITPATTLTPVCNALDDDSTVDSPLVWETGDDSTVDSPLVWETGVNKSPYEIARDKRVERNNQQLKMMGLDKFIGGSVLVVKKGEAKNKTVKKNNQGGGNIKCDDEIEDEKSVGKEDGKKEIIHN